MGLLGQVASVCAVAGSRLPSVSAMAVASWWRRTARRMVLMGSPWEKGSFILHRIAQYANGVDLDLAVVEFAEEHEREVHVPGFDPLGLGAGGDDL